MKNSQIRGDGLEAGISTALVGTGGTFFGLSSVAIHIDKIVPPGALLTTSQVIELIGVPTLSGILGCAVGAYLGRVMEDHYAPQIRESIDVVRKIDFKALPQAIGDTKGTVAAKMQQIGQAIERKAKQIANHLKQQTMSRQQDELHLR